MAVVVIIIKMASYRRPSVAGGSLDQFAATYSAAKDDVTSLGSNTNTSRRRESIAEPRFASYSLAPRPKLAPAVEEGKIELEKPPMDKPPTQRIAKATASESANAVVQEEQGPKATKFMCPSCGTCMEQVSDDKEIEAAPRNFRVTRKTPRYDDIDVAPDALPSPPFSRPSSTPPLVVSQKKACKPLPVPETPMSPATPLDSKAQLSAPAPNQKVQIPECSPRVRQRLIRKLRSSTVTDPLPETLYESVNLWIQRPLDIDDLPDTLSNALGLVHEGRARAVSDVSGVDSSAATGKSHAFRRRQLLLEKVLQTESKEASSSVRKQRPEEKEKEYRTGEGDAFGVPQHPLTGASPAIPARRGSLTDSISATIVACRPTTTIDKKRESDGSLNEARFAVDPFSSTTLRDIATFVDAAEKDLATQPKFGNVFPKVDPLSGSAFSETAKDRTEPSELFVRRAAHQSKVVGKQGHLVQDSATPELARSRNPSSKSDGSRDTSSEYRLTDEGVSPAGTTESAESGATVDTAVSVESVKQPEDAVVASGEGLVAATDVVTGEHITRQLLMSSILDALEIEPLKLKPKAPKPSLKTRTVTFQETEFRDQTDSSESLQFEASIKSGRKRGHTVATEKMDGKLPPNIPKAAAPKAMRARGYSFSDALPMPDVADFVSDAIEEHAAMMTSRPVPTKTRRDSTTVGSLATLYQYRSDSGFATVESSKRAVPIVTNSPAMRLVPMPAFPIEEEDSETDEETELRRPRPTLPRPIKSALRSPSTYAPPLPSQPQSQPQPQQALQQPPPFARAPMEPQQARRRSSIVSMFGRGRRSSSAAAMKQPSGPLPGVTPHH